MTFLPGIVDASAPATRGTPAFRARLRYGGAMSAAARAEAIAMAEKRNDDRPHDSTRHEPTRHEPTRHESPPQPRVYSAQEVRQGEIILRTRARKLIFFGGLVGIVLLSIIVSILR